MSRATVACLAVGVFHLCWLFSPHTVSDTRFARRVTGIERTPLNSTLCCPCICSSALHVAAVDVIDARCSALHTTQVLPWSGLSAVPVVATDPNFPGFEVRQYDAALWSRTNLTNVDFSAALDEGFHRLFDYIDQNKVPMEAPVLFKVVPGQGPTCKSAFQESFYFGCALICILFVSCLINDSVFYFSFCECIPCTGMSIRMVRSSPLSQLETQMCSLPEMRLWYALSCSLEAA